MGCVNPGSRFALAVCRAWSGRRGLVPSQKTSPRRPTQRRKTRGRGDDSRVRVSDLLDMITGSMPNLHGAACVGHTDIFDAATTKGAVSSGRRAAAEAICADCPCLAPCSTWLAGLPTGTRPIGVVAGTYVPVRSISHGLSWMHRR